MALFLILGRIIYLVIDVVHMLMLDTVSSTYMSVVEISMSGMIGALPVGDRLHAPALAEGLIAEIDRHVVVKEGGERFDDLDGFRQIDSGHLDFLTYNFGMLQWTH